MSSNLVIVALPREDDYVNKISSEKIAHMTLLDLGETSTVKNLATILNFVSHAANQSLKRFDLEVDHRGELGPSQSDVLFFSKTKWSGIECVQNFRSYLLKESNIKTAYDSTDQFPEWVPHLTLGSPTAPAKEDKRDYPGTSYVSFDRIAVWFGDFEGIEFPLNKYEYDWNVDSYMSAIGRGATEGILSHYGKKGMRWGVRSATRAGAARVSSARARSKSPTVTVVDKGKKLKISGGAGHPAHSEAVSARKIGQIAKKSGPKALSNAELRVFNERLNLEQNFSRLSFQDKSKGAQFVSKLLGKGAGKGVEAGGKAAVNSSFVKRKAAIGASALALAF